MVTSSAQGLPGTFARSFFGTATGTVGAASYSAVWTGARCRLSDQRFGPLLERGSKVASADNRERSGNYGKRLSGDHWLLLTVMERSGIEVRASAASSGEACDDVGGYGTVVIADRKSRTSLQEWHAAGQRPRSTTL
jgi:hypothetical protein